MTVKQLQLSDQIVAAFGGDADAARDFALAAVTAEAKQRAIALAYDSVQSALAEAAAPFEDGAEAPISPTPLDRIAANTAAVESLRTAVREVGVALATAAGVPDPAAIIDQALTGAAAPTPVEDVPVDAAPVDVPAEPAPVE